MSATMADLLDVVDELSARRPVAARLVAMTDDDSTGSPQLAEVLMADVTLTARVLRLANSAYFGLGGRVRTVTFAVTVVGFATIRSMAAVAAAGIEDADDLPEAFWPRAKATAVACGALAPTFALPAPEAFCLGLLVSLGQAILVQHDPAGYRELLAREDVVAGGRAGLLAAEAEVYGVRHTEVSAAALSAWSFPHELAGALHRLDAPDVPATAWSSCLRSALEVAARLVAPEEPAEDLEVLSGGVLTPERLQLLLPRVRDAVADSTW